MHSTMPILIDNIDQEVMVYGNNATLAVALLGMTEYACDVFSVCTSTTDKLGSRQRDLCP